MGIFFLHDDHFFDEEEYIKKQNMKLDNKVPIENIVSQEKEQKEVIFIEGDHLRNIFGDNAEEELEGFNNRVNNLFKRSRARSHNPVIDAIEETKNLQYPTLEIKPTTYKFVTEKKESWWKQILKYIFK